VLRGVAQDEFRIRRKGGDGACIQSGGRKPSLVDVDSHKLSGVVFTYIVQSRRQVLAGCG